MAAAVQAEMDEVKAEIKTVKARDPNHPRLPGLELQQAELLKKENLLLQAASAQAHPASNDSSLAMRAIQALEESVQAQREVIQAQQDAQRKRVLPSTDTGYWKTQKTPRFEPSYQAWLDDMRHAAGSPAQVPPEASHPPQDVGTPIDEPEVTVLQPKFMGWLRSLPGARHGTVNIGNKAREAVFFDNLQPRLYWVDTHDYVFLDGFKPDISCFQQQHSVAAFNLITFIELQRGSLDDSHRGKLAKHTDGMMQANPGRPCATGMLTSLWEMELYGKIAAQERPVQCALNTTTGDGAGAYWHALHQFVIGGPALHGWAVPVLLAPHLQESSLDIKAFMGVSQAVRVWEVALAEVHGLGTKAVCKQYLGGRRATSYARERDCLMFLARHWPTGVLPVFPLMVACDDDQQLVITQPIVQRAGSLTCRLVTQALAGLAVLHAMGFVYRDLEPKHWGVFPALTERTEAAMQRLQQASKLTEAQQDRLQELEGTAGLRTAAELQEVVAAVTQWRVAGAAPPGALEHTAIFDCSTCTLLGTSHGGYAGTLMCASDDVLRAMAAQGGLVAVPAYKQQDLVAFVKTCYLLTHAYALEQYQVLGVQLQDSKPSRAECVGMVRALWARLLDERTPSGREWSSLVRLAHVEDNVNGPPYLEVLRQLHTRLALLLPAHM